MPSPVGIAALRFRLYIAGTLRDETTLRAEDHDADDLALVLGRFHAELCAGADDAGLPWRLEVYDPDEDQGIVMESEQP